MYQRLIDRVKPERDQNPRPAYRTRWWLFAESRPAMRRALHGLRRYIVTPYTAKHRPFVFVQGDVLPDAMAYAVASEDSLHLGLLSSSCHLEWAIRFGGTLEDRPRYNSKATFLPFPFPCEDTGLTLVLKSRIRSLAEQLDTHRKSRQAAHESVTLTGLYNVLKKLRSGVALTAKDKLVHVQGLVSVLKSLHDELDAAVLTAYGWEDLQHALADHTLGEARAAAVDTLLERLVALNGKRAAEEAAGTVRWLRPEFQLRASEATQSEMDVTTESPDAEPPAAASAAALPKRPWPTRLPEQIKAVAELLASSGKPISLVELASRFAARGRWRERLPTILETLQALGRVRRVDGSSTLWQAT